ncbi:MAG: ribosome-associated ATPase/putative transporter RbbA [Rhodobacteraceae bacterium]|nr:ribosome-associated ATPase/putative transporter RbbA [Paracoccaceae bacterium]
MNPETNTQTAPTVAPVSKVSHAYKKVVALDDVSFDFASGRMVGVVGPDGVGKSTLLGLIAGARRLQDGTLEVLGGDMRSSRHRTRVSPRIAYMPQGLGKSLYEALSIRENLEFFGRMFGLDHDDLETRVEQLTKATGLHPFLDRPAGKLSGGMKQKLGLCCALIHDPDLMILDEPTTGVDPLSRRQLWELIAAIRRRRPEMCIIVSTAYMDEAEAFDELIAMDAGRVLATGTPAELKARTGTQSIEAAFIRLLPEERRRGHAELSIPSLKTEDRETAILAQGLTRRFGDFTAVDRVSFEIGVGEIFGFLGSNGCGKTTTMKMLTGLLPASEGQAFVFGTPVDTTSLRARERVGFMSQSFSLYGELTVTQNLVLHARLFDLPAERTQVRIAELTERFSLTDYSDVNAGSLPLGIRQRLSLAVAIIHEPEMLILDEPTSGVDPVARDEFWALLIELSRRDLVTIFISTHFMNEAMRCDRISLMHDGQVLVADTPDKLLERKGKTDLEAAFIEYIEDQIGKDSGNAGAADDLLGSADWTPISHAPKPTLLPFDFRRAFALSHREFVEVLRDPVRLAFAFLGSMMLLLMIAFGISHDVEDLRFAALDLDQTAESRSYIRNLSGSRFFVETDEARSLDDLERRLVTNDITLAIEIPPGFGRDAKRGVGPEVSFWIDGANTQRAGTIEGYVSAAHHSLIGQMMRETGYDPDVLEPVDIETRYRYNPGFESINAIGPSTPAILLMLFPAILMAVSVVREKEIGTITNFHVTPTRRLEFLVGKQIPYILIGFINFLGMALLTVIVLGVPLKGDVLPLMVGALFYVTAATGFGLLMSAITRTQVAAVFVTAIIAMVPTAQFSGMMQPISTLEGSAQVIGSLWPTGYFVHLSIGAFTKSLGFEELSGDLIALLIYAPLFTLIAALFLRKQER